jgi:hypothetical protein
MSRARHRSARSEVRSRIPAPRAILTRSTCRCRFTSLARPLARRYASALAPTAATPPGPSGRLEQRRLRRVCQGLACRNPRGRRGPRRRTGYVLLPDNDHLFGGLKLRTRRSAEALQTGGSVANFSTTAQTAGEGREEAAALLVEAAGGNPCGRAVARCVWGGEKARGAAELRQPMESSGALRADGITGCARDGGGSAAR